MFAEAGQGSAASDLQGSTATYAKCLHMYQMCVHACFLCSFARSSLILSFSALSLMQCSDWGAERLSRQQLQYAALDAFLSLQMAVQLHQKLLANAHHTLANAPAAAAAAGKGRMPAGASNACNDGSTTAVGVDAAAAVAVAATPADAAAFLLPYAVAAPCSSGKHDKVLATRSGPVLPTRTMQQQKQQQKLHEPLLLPPWLLASLMQGSTQVSMQHDQQQQEQQSLPAGERVKQLFHAAQLQLHVQQYLRAWPALQQHLQQRRQRRKRDQQRQQHQQRQQLNEQQLSLQALQQERRQRQLEQLQRLGQVAAAPSRNIFDRMQHLKPARLPTRKSLQYENCRILGPDGKALATCGIKKVWDLRCDCYITVMLASNPANMSECTWS